jgi:hypothetical protein
LRAQAEALIGVGTNSIGGFSFGLHGVVGLSCLAREILATWSFLSVLVCRRYQPCRVRGCVGVVVRRSAKMRRRCYTSPMASLRNDERCGGESAGE